MRLPPQPNYDRPYPRRYPGPRLYANPSNDADYMRWLEWNWGKVQHNFWRGAPIGIIFVVVAMGLIIAVSGAMQ